MVKVVSLLLLVTPILGMELPFTVTDCGDTGIKSVTLNHLDISPKPLELFMVTKLNVTTDFVLASELNNDIRVKINIKKVLGRWDIPLLSVTKPSCDLMQDKGFRPILCPLFTRRGNCRCPVKAGSHFKHRNTTITVDLSALPVPKFLFKLGTGNWETDITGRDRYDREVFCHRIRTHTKIIV